MHPPDPRPESEPVRLVRGEASDALSPSLARLWSTAPPTGEREREALRRMRDLGGWLREQHEQPRPELEAEPAALRTALAALEHWPADDRHDDAPHRVSLARWVAALAASPAPARSLDGLTLDRVHWAEEGLEVSSPSTAPRGVVAPAALDVGWLTGDLVALTHEARAHGVDPSGYERLLTAFLIGYDGLTGEGEGRSLEVRRAAAARLLVRADEAAGTEDGDRDLELCRVLVEHCWAEGRRAS